MRNKVLHGLHRIIAYLIPQRSSRTNFINDLYRRTTLVLRYDLRIISFAVIHLTIPIMYADVGRPTANHDKVQQLQLCQPFRACKHAL